MPPEIGSAPTSEALGVHVLGLALTSEAFKVMFELRALPFTVLLVGTAPTSLAVGVHVFGLAPTCAAVTPWGLLLFAICRFYCLRYARGHPSAPY